MTQGGENQQNIKSEDNSEVHGVNCYSDGEGKFMEWSQSLRATLFNPLLKVLSKLGFTATHISILSLITGLAFCPCFIWINQAFAFVLLFIHSLLDGLDGPLATIPWHCFQSWFFHGHYGRSDSCNHHRDNDDIYSTCWNMGGFALHIFLCCSGGFCLCQKCT